jgi:hypothetical protein
MHEGSCTQVAIVSSALHSWQHVLKAGVISGVSGAQMYSHEMLQQVLTLL